VQGEPTLYLARDKGIATGEFSRHFSDNRSQGLTQKIQRRQIWRFTVKLNRTLNIDGFVKSPKNANFQISHLMISIGYGIVI